MSKENLSSEEEKVSVEGNSLEELRRENIVNGDGVIGAVRCSERGYLLVRRSEEETMTGKWEFPGGGIDEADQSLEDAVIREVEEESGLEAELIKKGDPFIGEGATDHWILHPFLLEVDTEAKVELSEEHDRYRWFENLQDLDKIETVGEMQAVEALGLK